MSIFGSIDDPRSHINQLHDLVDILLIGIVSVISEAETWKQMPCWLESLILFYKKYVLYLGIKGKQQTLIFNIIN